MRNALASRIVRASSGGPHDGDRGRPSDPPRVYRLRRARGDPAAGPPAFETEGSTPIANRQLRKEGTGAITGGEVDPRFARPLLPVEDVPIDE